MLRLTISVGAEELVSIKEAAKASDRSVSGVIRLVVRAAIARGDLIG